MHIRVLCVTNLAWILAALFHAAAAMAAAPQRQFKDGDFPNIATEDPLTPEAQLKKFHLPPGFEIQLVAAEPDVRKPINLSFDSAGRLYFTQSVEYPFPAKKTPGRDEVRIVEGIGPNGRAAKVSTFADGLNIPIGLTPIPHGVIVFSIPNIYECLDPQGIGHATERRVLYGPFEFRDTHGLNSSFTRGLDGWVYANHGYVNDDHIVGKDGQRVAMQSGNTYRMKADGSHIEYFAHGHVNPFGMTFDPLDNMYVSDCHTLPAYLVLRGAYYPSFGKPHDGLGFGPEMLDHAHGPTAIAGIVYYAAEQFPREYRDAIFIGNPVSHRVVWDKLESRGSFGWAVEQPDFLVCDDPWFRPVDLKLGPDGALYVADFYNRIIGHYEVDLNHPGRDRERGRIWRIVYKGTGDKAAAVAAMPSPPTAEAGADQLIVRLGDPNLVVRTQATNELVDRIGKAAAEPLAKLIARDDSLPAQRAHGLWVLQRLGALDDKLVARLIDDPDRLVRVHMVKAIAERAAWDREKLPLANLIRNKLSDPDAYVRRAAADALSRHPEPANVKPLVELWSKTPGADTHLIFVARMALRDQLASSGTYAAIARDGLPGDNAESAQRLAEVSLGLPNAEAAAFILQYLTNKPSDLERLPAYLHHVARQLPAARLAELFKVAEALRTKRPDLSDQREMLREVQRGLQERGSPALPANVQAWAADIATRLLTAGDVDQVNQGIELARELHIVGAFERLAAIVAGAELAAARPAAIDACVALDSGRSIGLLSDVLGRGSESLAVRQKAAQALASINSDPARAELLRRLVAAPERLGVDIAAGLAATKPGAESLLASVAEGKTSARLLREPTVVNRLRGSGLPTVDERISQLTAKLPPDDDRLARLVLERHDGFLKAKPEVEKGHQAFNKVCAACHKIGGEGHKIGPELDGIGVRGLDRLLEDVLDPNRNVDQAFRASLMTTNDGRTMSGLVLREEGEVLIIADQQGKEIRIPKKEISDRTTQMLSPMPANVADLLTEPEFYNLMAFLLTQQSQGQGPGGTGQGTK